MKLNIEEDPWKKICDDLGISNNIHSFVSQRIPRKIIQRYGRPEKLIPIYTREHLISKHPFLSMNKLTPMRVGKDEAILTKASLIQEIPRYKRNEPLSIKLSGEKEDEAQKFIKYTGDTEAKLLAIAYNHGVFSRAFNNDNSKKYDLGIYGKMNLPKTEIGLVDFEGKEKMYREKISNVQFELDFSFEDESNIFIIEAKIGVAKTFSSLQLFYPYIILKKYALESNKVIRPILLVIQNFSKEEILYRILEYKFKYPDVPNSIDLKKQINVSLLLSSQYHFS